MSRRRNIAKITPPSYTPKFQAGQRVQISPVGIEYQIAPAGTQGTVETCGLIVRILIDGTDQAHNYALDYWEAPLFTE
jgi:hypothetical protein